MMVSWSFLTPIYRLQPGFQAHILGSVFRGKEEKIKKKKLSIMLFFLFLPNILYMTIFIIKGQLT